MIDLHRSRTVSRACLAVLLGWAVSQAAFAQTVYPYPDELPDLYHFASLPPVSYPLPDGRKLVGAFTARGIGVTRVLADGSIDRSFGRAGLATLVAWGGGAYGVLPVLAVQQDGRILVAHAAKDNSHVAGCDYYYTDCNMHTVLHRLDAEGGLDLSFNGYGRLVLRIGGAPTQQHAEDSDEHFVRSITLGADGSALLGSFSGVMARVLPGGVLDRTTLYPAREHDFIAAVPFYHAGLDQFFVSADVGEIAGLDRQWSANDGWFHVYPAGWTATPTVPVCRFYGLPEAGLDSHLLTANADECAALEAAEGHTGWRLESREVFRVELPDPDTGECAAGRAPVYRLWNARPDSGHVLTTAWYARRNLMAIGYISEGWGPLGVAMCSATW